MQVLVVQPAGSCSQPDKVTSGCFSERHLRCVPLRRVARIRLHPVNCRYRHMALEVGSMIIRLTDYSALPVHMYVHTYSVHRLAANPSASKPSCLLPSYAQLLHCRTQNHSPAVLPWLPTVTAVQTLRRSVTVMGRWRTTKVLMQSRYGCQILTDCP